MTVTFDTESFFNYVLNNKFFCFQKRELHFVVEGFINRGIDFILSKLKGFQYFDSKVIKPFPCFSYAMRKVVGGV